MYITTTVRETPEKQMSFEELFDLMISTDWLEVKEMPEERNARKPYGKTWHCETVPEKYRKACDPYRLLRILNEFNDRYAELIASDKSEHYRKFFIPKHSGGWREINAPDSEITLAQVELRTIFETEFHATNHACAHAYVKNRSPYTAVSLHQRNGSKWFLKTDIKDFFPNTTPEFVYGMLSQIYPFGILCETPEGQAALKKALSVCFLNGGLPMGTKISPMLTNLMMIPFDYELSKLLRDMKNPENNLDGVGRRFVYTRYADNVDISCGVGFDQQMILNRIQDLFVKFNAPYTIKQEKTTYGSAAGKNFMLGIMLNKDNRMTLGTKKRKTIEAMVFNYMKDRTNNVSMSLDILQHIQGVLGYYKYIDGDGYGALIRKYNQKFNGNVEQYLKADLKAA